jgi:hypothetical protein
MFGLMLAVLVGGLFGLVISQAQEAMQTSALLSQFVDSLALCGAIAAILGKAWWLRFCGLVCFFPLCLLRAEKLHSGPLLYEQLEILVLLLTDADPEIRQVADTTLNRIPVETQVLMVHGPPWGYGDRVIGRLTGDELHVGSRTLDETLARLPNLKLMVFGHIHEGAGVYRHANGLTLVNASLMDVAYNPANMPRMYEL